METKTNNSTFNHVDNLTQSSYADRIASKFLSSLGARNLVFTTKLAPVTENHPGEDILVNVSGVIDTGDSTTAGLKINADFWPNRDCTEEDKAALLGPTGKGRVIDDVTLRYGIYRGVDPITGEAITTVGRTPKIEEFYVDGKLYILGGERKKYNAD